jgi:hypothetical protein
MNVVNTGGGDGWNLAPGFWIPEVYDYYTGYTFSYPDTTTTGVLDDASEKIEITREINGQQITVKQAQLIDHYADSYVHDKTEQEDGTLHHFSRRIKYVYVVYAPQDYDGLMLQ